MAYTLNLGPKKRKPRRDQTDMATKQEQMLEERIAYARKELGRAIWDLKLYRRDPRKWAKWKARQMLGSSRLKQLLWKIRLPKK